MAIGRLDKVTGNVMGINGEGKEVSFELSVRDIKHIRRCLKFYDYTFPSPKTEKNELIGNFERFGRRNSGRSNRVVIRNKLMIDKGGKCALCGTTERVTTDHILPLSQGGTNRKSNLQLLCIKHHNEKNLKMRIRMKQEELVYLENKLKVGNYSKKQVDGVGW